MKSRNALGLILTLLILGLAYKGNYGQAPNKVLPVILEDPESLENQSLRLSSSAKINSLFVRHAQTQEPILIILVTHDDRLTQKIRDIFPTRRTPLLLSISSMPAKESHIDLDLFRFRQNDKIWSSVDQVEKAWFVLFKDAKFGGPINQGEIQRGLVLLPEWFDLQQPITIAYTKSERTLNLM